ncbi:MAG: hypothetical protein AAGE52_23440 [Myxococcota bacterium]
MRFAFCLLLLAPALARADVVPQPPEECFEGTSPETCHGGAYCAPIRCTADSDCEGDLICDVRTYCVDVINCAGLIGPGEDPRDFDVDQITGECRDSCTGGCNEIRLCVPPLPMGEGGGGCSVGGVPNAFCGMLALLVLRRRRR